MGDNRDSRDGTTAPSDRSDDVILKDLLGVSDAAMDHAMAIAYQLYLTGRFTETEMICRGLIACDHRYWWSHCLHGSALRHLGRYDDALASVEAGLKYEPRQAKLLLMRTELRLALAKRDAIPAGSSAPPASPGTPPWPAKPGTFQNRRLGQSDLPKEYP